MAQMDLIPIFLFCIFVLQSKFSYFLHLLFPLFGMLNHAFLLLKHADYTVEMLFSLCGLLFQVLHQFGIHFLGSVLLLFHS